MKLPFILLSCLMISLCIQAQDFQKLAFQNSTINRFEVADIDHDGYPDILGVKSILNFSADAYWFRNLGTNPPTFEEIPIFILENIFIDDFQIGDLDNDGDEDFVLVDHETSNLIMYENNGAALFTPIQLNISGAEKIWLRDLDDDGDTDIVGLNELTSELFVYNNNGQASFGQMIIPNVASFIEDIDIGDIDNDGDLDIVVGILTFSADHIILLKNNGLLNFERTVVANNSFVGIREVLLEDINADGNLDICAIKSSAVDCWINDGSLNFSQQRIITSNLSSPAGFRSFGTEDYNGDSHLDFVVGNNDITGNGGVNWHKTLTIDPWTNEERKVGGTVTAFKYGHADFDMDGDVDILLTNGDVWLYLNEIEQEPVATFDLEKSKIEIFPNPVDNVLHIKNIDNQELRYQLNDVNGKIVQNGRFRSNELSIKTQSTGIYILQLWNDRDEKPIFQTKIYKN